MTDKNSKVEPASKKAWQDLELKQLDVPSATQTGTPLSALQPGESFNFYRNS